jgi:hypothetical protein
MPETAHMKRESSYRLRLPSIGRSNLKRKYLTLN